MKIEYLSGKGIEKAWGSPDAPSALTTWSEDGKEVTISLPFNVSTGTKLHEMYHARPDRYKGNRPPSKVYWKDLVREELGACEFAALKKGKSTISGRDICGITKYLLERGVKPSVIASAMASGLDELGYRVDPAYKKLLWDDAMRRYRQYRNERRK